MWNIQMFRLIGSLVRRGYRDDLIRVVHEHWHRHFYEQGHAKTDPEHAKHEMVEALARTRANPNFIVDRTNEVDHSALRDALVPEPWQQALIQGAFIAPGDQGPTLLVPTQNLDSCTTTLVPDCMNSAPAALRAVTLYPGKRVTQIGERLCISEDERVFVEALLVMVTYKRVYTEEARLVMTHNQLRSWVRARHGREWDNQQIERLKRKFIARPGDGKVASRFELLRETVKGGKQKGRRTGVPSEYESTGMELLLSPDARRTPTAPVAALVALDGECLDHGVDREASSTDQ
jgi:hypothetical protein